ncbi:MAG: NAD-dependent epimerase/dehydratase family protein [Pseudanabaenaceae cyanobacterium]
MELLGATGFIGSRLGQAILDRGDQLFVLTRNVPKGQTLFPTAAVLDWGNDRLVSTALATCDSVVNSAGRSIIGGVGHCGASCPSSSWDWGK